MSCLFVLSHFSISMSPGPTFGPLFTQSQIRFWLGFRPRHRWGSSQLDLKGGQTRERGKAGEEGRGRKWGKGNGGDKSPRCHETPHRPHRPHQPHRPQILVFQLWKRIESTCCDMKTGTFECSAKDRPNYDMAGTINAVVITDYPPTAPSAPAPKIDISPVKKALALWNRHF